MHYERQKYEKLISESPLFSYDREKEHSAYKRESYRMVEFLYCYLLAINEAKYEPYGCEITEVAIRCIGNYDSSKGEFLSYFNAAWKQEYSHILGVQIYEEKFRGIRISEDDRRAVRKYIKLAGEIGTEYSTDELFRRLSDAMALPINRIRELAEINSIAVTGDSYSGSDGEEQSLWDQIPGTESASLELETEEEIEEVFNQIESVFTDLQNRQKPIVSDIITSKICPFIEYMDTKKFSFISSAVIEEYKKSGIVPSQRDIARKYGRDEASISRTVNVFLKKLKRED